VHQGVAVTTWHTLKTTYKVSDFISWKRDGALRLNPDFQRRSVWKPGAKSYLIDTIIRGFPIPIIFLRDGKTNIKTLTPRRDVVDGQQRLRTVISFCAPNLIDNFEEGRDDFTIMEEHNAEFAGASFADLPPETQNAILDYQFTVTVFPSDTGDRTVKQVFARMNSSGYRLNAQELRNAEFFGKFKTVAESLATEQLEHWRDWRGFTADGLARMLEVEMSSEFIIVMLDGISEKDEKTIGRFYETYDKRFDHQQEVERRFRRVFAVLDEHFSDQIPELFSKRTIFYALWVAIYDVLYGIESTLSRRPARVITSRQKAKIVQGGRQIAEETASEAIMEATTRRTTHIRERKRLVEFLLKAK